MRRERILARGLRIISQQGQEVDAVIDAIFGHALEICEAEFDILLIITAISGSARCGPAISHRLAVSGL